MKLNYSTSPSLWVILRASMLFAFLCVLPKLAFSQEVSTEFAKFQDRLQKLSNEIDASQRRMLSSAQVFAAQEAAYAQLDYVAQLATSTHREFSVLDQVLHLAMLVTDKRAIPLARKSVELQRDYMVKQLTHAVGHIEKTMHRAGDQETSRLMLQARDLFRAANQFLVVSNLPVP